MRIIGGKLGGKTLRSPPGRIARPTPERVREALFSILASVVAESRVLDLFAGSGALGLEALSRGASHVTYVEHARACLPIIRTNTHQVREHTRLLPIDAQRALAKLAREGQTFDLIFLDPPYGAKLLDSCLQHIARHSMLREKGWVICEHPKHHLPPDPPTAWYRQKTRNYGDVCLSLYQHQQGRDNE